MEVTRPWGWSSGVSESLSSVRTRKSSPRDVNITLGKYKQLDPALEDDGPQFENCFIRLNQLTCYLAENGSVKHSQAFSTRKSIPSKLLLHPKLAGNNSDALRADGAFNGEPLRDLQPPTVEEVRKLISAMPSKSSPIDSIPTSILKSCSDVFALLITRLATLSFHEGSFPDSYKTASVTPLLKKKDSDRDDPANFRPISNLHTISKLLERLVLSRIMPHVENSPNFNRFQSAYRRGYSTESAILRMLNDVYCAADRKRRSMIVLLDLSAAFDTIDIDTLLRRLEHTFGITGSALLWMKTYLEDRTQFVRIGDDRSGSVHCRFGVPQGSVLGPALFSTYVAPIAGVISSFGVHHTQYADDTQLYIELRDNAVTSLDNCFRAVHQWFHRERSRPQPRQVGSDRHWHGR